MECFVTRCKCFCVCAVMPVSAKGLGISLGFTRFLNKCKFMERIIASEMLSYLRAHDVISKQQHGFLSRRCTESNLLECLNDWDFSSE